MSMQNCSFSLRNASCFVLHLSILLFTTSFSGCQILGPEEYAEWPRSLPLALDLPEVDLEDLVSGKVSGVSVNVSGYVVRISQCPIDSDCTFGNYFVIAGSRSFDPDLDLSVHIYTRTPKEFRIGQKGRFSIHARIDTSGAFLRHYHNLIAYN